MRLRRIPDRSRRGQVLIILLGTLFLGGSAALAGGVFVTGMTTKEITRALKREVTDEDRLHAARRVIDSWERDAERFLESMDERREELLEQMQRHDADRATIDALLRRQDTAVDDMTRRVVDYRFELRDHLGAEEWRAVFGPAAAATEEGP
jgi:DNA-binding transcriptional MerR regulator